MDIARLQQQPQQRQQPQSDLRQRPVTVWKHKRGARLHILCRHQPSALHAYQPFTEHIAGPLPLVQRQPRHMGFLQVAMGRPLRDKHKRHIQPVKTKRQPQHDTQRLYEDRRERHTQRLLRPPQQHLFLQRRLKLFVDPPRRPLHQASRRLQAVALYKQQSQLSSRPLRRTMDRPCHKHAP